MIRFIKILSALLCLSTLGVFFQNGAYVCGIINLGVLGYLVYDVYMLYKEFMENATTMLYSNGNGILNGGYGYGYYGSNIPDEHIRYIPTGGTVEVNVEPKKTNTLEPTSLIHLSNNIISLGEANVKNGIVRSKRYSFTKTSITKSVFKRKKETHNGEKTALEYPSKKVITDEEDNSVVMVKNTKKINSLVEKVYNCIIDYIKTTSEYKNSEVVGILRSISYIDIVNGLVLIYVNHNIISSRNLPKLKDLDEYITTKIDAIECVVYEDYKYLSVADYYMRKLTF